MSAVLWVACANGKNGTYSAEPVKSTTGDSMAQSDKPVAATSRDETPLSPTPDMALEAASASGELRFDFTEHIALAHLRSSGLLMDFGHESRNKYTIGDWKTGWRGNYLKDGVTYSLLESAAARVFFFLDENEAGDGRLVIRARGIGQKSKGRLYLNGSGLGPVEFGPEFSHVTVEIKGLLKPGNNELLLRPGNGAKASDGKFARLAVDYIRVIPAGTDESQAASAATAVLDGDEGGASKAIRLRGGDRLTWYVAVPEAAFLRASVRSTGQGRESDVAVGLYKNGTLRSELFTGKVDHRGTDMDASLSVCADDICALDIQVNSGEVLFERLQMREPMTEVSSASGKRSAQNVVLVLIDTLRADKLSAYNRDSRVQTPFLDTLAKESMIFENAWAQENWTKPSITSLLSGLYSATHQNKSENNKVPSSVVMMQEHFSKLGFETAGFVANGYVSDKFGFKRGWDTWTNYVREGKRNRAEFVADDAVNWLRKRRDEKPFFLYIHTIDPHVPYIPPAKYRALYDNEPYNGVVTATETAKLLEKVKTGALKLTDRDKFRLEALYDGEISYHDDYLVKVYDELKAQGLLDNTVLIVTADHGEEFFEHGSVGHGHSLYEELLHVPLIIRLPGAAQGASGGARF
ncbi:MAG: sulfatase, partial [Deltaproteobacteria bacterium]|nr:sulfatase [Deltaproteobacteria bacterium]